MFNGFVHQSHQIAFFTFYNYSLLIHTAKYPLFDCLNSQIYCLVSFTFHSIMSYYNWLELNYFKVPNNVRRSFINFQYFSYPYDLIWDRSFISFWNNQSNYVFFMKKTCLLTNKFNFIAKFPDPMSIWTRTFIIFCKFSSPYVYLDLYVYLEL